MGRSMFEFTGDTEKEIRFQNGLEWLDIDSQCFSTFKIDNTASVQEYHHKKQPDCSLVISVFQRNDTEIVQTKEDGIRWCPHTMESPAS